MRIVSLLPSATEIVYALGLGDSLVGVTHECDYPGAARSLPKLTQSLLPDGMTSAEIDSAVSASLRDQHTVYALDAALLQDLEPDFVLTQSLCEVCAVPREHVDEAVCTMPKAATVISLDPPSLNGMLSDIERVAGALQVPERGEDVVAQLRVRLRRLTKLISSAATRPRVFAAEWLDPIFCGGHWIPEMILHAGGEDALGKPGVDSVRVDWDAVRKWAPEVLVMMPCGFNAQGALREARWMTQRPGWQELPAVQSGRVFVVDANAYFARPGPRLVDGVEILARLLHPSIFSRPLRPGDAYRLLPGSRDEFEAYV
jgi:iron complex transport system substrate-binding protein